LSKSPILGVLKTAKSAIFIKKPGFRGPKNPKSAKKAHFLAFLGQKVPKTRFFAKNHYVGVAVY
jgi:hypothetical protein